MLLACHERPGWRGIVPNAVLRKYWRQAVVGIAVVVAVATPSNDPFSMLALSVPLWVFYGVAVVFGWVRERRRSNRRPSV